MKRLFTGLLMLGILLSLAACGEAPSENTDTSSRTPAQEQTSVTLAETVIFDQANIKITVLNIGEGEDSNPEIRLRAENLSAEAITLQADRTSVNGYVISPRLALTAAAGSTAEGTLSFPAEELQLAGITTVKDLEFTLHVYHADTGAKIVSSGVIKLTTSATGHIQTNQQGGTPLYDSMGIKILPYRSQTESGTDTEHATDTAAGFLPLTSGGTSSSTEEAPLTTDSTDAPTDLPTDAPTDESADSAEPLPEDTVPEDLKIRFYVENNSEKDLTLSTVNVLLDGTEAVPAFSATVPAGKRAFCTLTFSGILLKEQNILNPSTLTLQFRLNHGENAEPTLSDPITVTLTK